MTKSLQRLIAIVVCSLLFITAEGQSDNKESKPYKVATTGRQLVIKSSKTIQHVMVWTTGGDRVVEQRGINNTSFTIDIPLNRKTFFLMVGMANGKVYTEKIGVQ